MSQSTRNPFLCGRMFLSLVAVFIGGCMSADSVLSGDMKLAEDSQTLSPPAAGEAVVSETVAANSGPQLFINEFMASNVSTKKDEFNEYDDWVEIYNADSNPVDVGGMYLTDDLTNLTKCPIPANNPAATTIPAYGYLLFWLDGQPGQGTRHIDTKLSKSGEQLGLVAADGVTVLDSLTFGPQADDVSFGRQPDGGANWVYFDKAYATPGTANSALLPAPAPVFSVSGGLYSGSVSLELSVPTPPPGTHIYYTLDGSEPTNGITSTSYSYMPQETRNGATKAGNGSITTRYYQTFEYTTTPIITSATTVVRARVYATNRMPSPIITNTYVTNLTNPSNLAVVSVSSPPRYLWGNYRDAVTGGILVMGPNLEELWNPYGGDFWFDRSNLMQEEWNRPGHMEFFEPNGTRAFSQDIEIRSGGSSTQLGPQKPMVLYAVGGERFNYRVFPDLDLDSFRILVLHCSGDDWPFTQLRDDTVHGLLRDLDVDTQAYRPAIVYVNGAYYGCMGIRERRNKDYVASHHNVDANQVDILDNYGYDDTSAAFEGEVNEGSAAAYEAMINECFIGKDLSQAANYAAVKQRMEVDEYLDWITTEIIISNCDWPGGNVRLWRPQVANGRWRWILIDTDYSFNIPALNSVAVTTGTFTGYDMIAHATAPSSGHWSNPASSTYLFRRLLGNLDFRNEFIRRVADHLNITFNPTRVKADIDAKKAAVYSEMTRSGGQFDRWKNDYNPWSYTHASMDSPGYWMVPINCPINASWPTWDASIQRMKNFADDHPAILRDQVSTRWGLGGSVSLNFAVNPSGAGQIKVNRLILPVPAGSSWTGKYFRTVPIQLAAMPARGYRFTGWTGITGASVTSITPATDNVTITANFTAAVANDNAVVINEINYNSAPDFDPEDWVELYNPHDWTVDLSGWRFKDSDDSNVYTFPPHTTIGPNAYLVLCHNAVDFHSAFPAVENYLGDFAFNLDNEGDQVRLYDAAGNLVDSVTFTDADPWPTLPDGAGPTLELRNPAVDNAGPACWAASAGHGTPGTANSVYTVAPHMTGWQVTANVGRPGETTFAVTDGYVEPRSAGLSRFSILFDRAMDTSVTDPAAVSITGAANGDQSSRVSSLIWDGSGTKVTVTLSSSLPDADTYTVTVNSLVKSPAGMPVVGDCDVVLKSLAGDAGGSGRVGFEDFAVLQNNYGQSGKTAAQGDFNGDGTVTFEDFAILQNNYGRSVP